MFSTMRVTQLRNVTFLMCLLSSSIFVQDAACGQGLLGHKFVSVGYTAVRPSSHELRAFSSWFHGVDVQANVPLSETLDWHTELATQFFDGDTSVSGIPVTVDAELVFVTTTLTKHFMPFGNIDPYVGLGLGYAESTIRFESSVLSLKSDDDAFGVGWRAGIEWRLTDSLAIQTEINGGDTFEDFDLNDAMIDNIDLKSRVIYWWNDLYFSGFTIGSDFDDTELTLGVFLGIGRY